MTRRTALKSAPEPAVTSLLTRHEVLARHLPGLNSRWLAECRTAALARFQEAGLPGRQVEEWRYTPLGALAGIAFQPARLSPAAEVHALPTAILPLDGCRLMMVNGGLDAALCDLGRLPKGLQVHSLAHVLNTHPERLEPWLATSAAGPMADLNSASFHDGVLIHLAAGTVAETPLHLVSVGVAVDHPVDFHPRVVVVLEDEARATLVESHCGVVDQPYFSNGVVEIYLGRNAHLTHVKLQDEAPEGWHVASHAVDLAEGAAYHATVLHTGGRLARHQVRVRLRGPHAEARLDGAYLVDGIAQVDDTIVIDHEAPHCRSRQLWKGVLDGKGRGVFQGKVRVARAAQKTDAYQLSRALLLSPQAEADGKPELEIYADDVKCGHGSAVGALDDAALFYLTSRGIGRAEARRILMEAFVAEVIDGVEEPAVREALAGLVRRRLGGMG